MDGTRAVASPVLNTTILRKPSFDPLWFPRGSEDRVLQIIMVLHWSGDTPSVPSLADGENIDQESAERRILAGTAQNDVYE